MLECLLSCARSRVKRDLINLRVPLVHGLNCFHGFRHRFPRVSLKLQPQGILCHLKYYEASADMFFRKGDSISSLQDMQGANSGIVKKSSDVLVSGILVDLS